MTSPQARRLLGMVFAGYLAALTFVVFQPDGSTSGGAVDVTVRVLHTIGFPRFTFWHVEKALNVALFLPLGVLGVLLWRRLPWAAWALAGLVLSGFFETVQGLFLTDRVADGWDVVMNTAGSTLGALATAVLLHELHLQRLPRTSRRSLLPPPLLAVIAAGVGVVMVGLVLGPTSQLPSRAVFAVADRIREWGGPDILADYDTWEKLLNVALFVPIAGVAALIRPGWSLLRFVLLGFLGSLAIEMTQGVLLPGRDASFADLATNTVGALIGAGVVKLGVATYDRVRAARTPSPEPAGDRQ